MSGITRDIYLQARNPQHIRDFRVIAGLDDQYKNGTLSLSVEVTNPAESNVPLVLEVQLNDEKNTVKSFTQKVEAISRANMASFSGTIPEVKLWSAEIPNLYELLIILKSDKGEIIEVLRRIPHQRNP
jgi:beta-galactosidase